MLQLDVWRGDDCLRSVVGLGRQRNDWLSRKFGIRLLGRGRVSAPRVERWQVFRGLVVDDLRTLERGIQRRLRVQLEKSNKRDKQGECHNVISGRLHESSPRQPALHEYVRPECGGGGSEFERGKLGWLYQIAKIIEEGLMPAGEFDLEAHVGEPGLRGRFFHWDGARNVHHPMLDGKRRCGVAGRARERARHRGRT